MPDKRAKLLISGTVQGVSFRASTEEVAKKLDLTGFVRNLSDGRVEIVAEGSPESLVALEQWCRSGPPAADVTGVDSDREPSQNEFSEFSIR